MNKQMGRARVQGQANNTYMCTTLVVYMRGDEPTADGSARLTVFLFRILFAVHIVKYRVEARAGRRRLGFALLCIFVIAKPTHLDLLRLARGYVWGSKWFVVFRFRLATFRHPYILIMMSVSCCVCEDLLKGISYSNEVTLNALRNTRAATDAVPVPPPAVI